MTIKKLILVSLFILTAGCASKVLKYEKTEELKKNKEFEQIVDIVPTPSAEVKPPVEAPVLLPQEPEVVDKSEIKPLVEKPKKQISKSKKKEAEKNIREPELESSVGFLGRRPIVDPFRVGEKVIHDVNFSTFNAGSLELSVEPFAVVNGRKSYQFRIGIKTNRIFSTFHSVDDFVITWLDFEELIPSVFKLTVRETNQLRETQGLFDFSQRKATLWDKKVTEKEGEVQRKVQWEILDYSQNIYSSAFYLRFFHFEVGKEISFRVSNENENLVFKGKVLRKEKINTDVGEFNAFVLKPEIQLQGQYKPVGDIYMWISDDDRKFILKIESKVKIGTLTSEIVKLIPGT